MKRSAINMRKTAASSMKNWVMTDIENITRAATADTAWSASGHDLDEIARATFNREEYPLIMGVVWQRLTSRRWRCVYKGLELLRHLIFHGSARCLDEARDAKYHIQALQGFRYIDSRTGKDEGNSVRVKAKEIYDLLENNALLDEEREKSKALRAKMGLGSGGGGPSYEGYGSSSYGYGGYGNEQQSFGSGDNQNSQPHGGYNPHTYHYDEELDGPRDGVPGSSNDNSPHVSKKDKPAAPQIQAPPPPQVDDLLGLDYNPASHKDTSQPTVELFDDGNDDFNPRALPAPPIHSSSKSNHSDPLALLLEDAPHLTPLALPPATIQPMSTGKVSDDIFGSVAQHSAGPNGAGMGNHSASSSFPMQPANTMTGTPQRQPTFGFDPFDTSASYGATNSSGFTNSNAQTQSQLQPQQLQGTKSAPKPVATEDLFSGLVDLNINK